MNVVRSPSRAPLNAASAAGPPVESDGRDSSLDRILSISASSTRTMPPFSPETLARKESGTWAVRSTMGEPTPASSNSAAVLVMGGSFGDRQARRQERLVVDLDQYRVLPGRLEAQVADLGYQVDPGQ